MIEGRVNEALEPVVEVGLKRGDTITTILAVVDWDKRTKDGGYLPLSVRSFLTEREL